MTTSFHSVSKCAAFVLLLALSVPLFCQTQSQAEAEQYIRESERQWAESVARGQTADIERILADDFLGVDPEGKIYDKKSMVADTKNAPKYFLSNHLNEVKVRFFGDTAVAQSHGCGEPARRSTAASCGRTRG